MTATDIAKLVSETGVGVAALYLLAGLKHEIGRLQGTLETLAKFVGGSRNAGE